MKHGWFRFPVSDEGRTSGRPREEGKENESGEREDGLNDVHTDKGSKAHSNLPRGRITRRFEDGHSIRCSSAGSLQVNHRRIRSQDAERVVSLTMSRALEVHLRALRLSTPVDYPRIVFARQTASLNVQRAFHTSRNIETRRLRVRLRVQQKTQVRGAHHTEMAFSGLVPAAEARTSASCRVVTGLRGRGRWVDSRFSQVRVPGEQGRASFAYSKWPPSVAAQTLARRLTR
ncbi:hypothetical protein C8Q70DRAFT_66073 [Cubamyces menziesii]|nr:hypothetical protein C8Q70DRAFT_66073 [Cubamyces menziesii]